jgi:hypothetical protein
MTSLCCRCHQLLEASARSCHACGADLRIQVPRLVDLTEREADEERDRLALVSALVAGFDDEPPRPKPAWGVNTVTMLDLELGPLRIGRFPSADDVLPVGAPRRSWRRR